MAIEDADARLPDAGDTRANVSGEKLRNLRAAMKDSFAAVGITDASGVLEYVNQRFEEVAGYRAAEIVGHHIQMLIADEELGQSVWATLSTGRSWRGEIANRRPDGEKYYVLASIQPLRSDDGDITHYIGVIVDVTEQRQVQQELAESEACWRALVENAPDLIAVVDEDGVVTRLNRAPHGSTMEDALGRLVYDFVLPESREAWCKGLAEVFATGRHVEFEVTASDTRGETRWYAIMLGAVRDGDSVVAAVASMRDVTTRKQAEEDLKNREAHWRALVENHPDHILTVDKDGVMTSLNWNMPGIAVEEVVGRTVYEFVCEEYRGIWREALAGVFTGGRRAEFEVKTVGVTVNPQWYAITLSAVYDGANVIAGIANLRNITQRKEAEERLRAIATAVSDIIAVVDEDGRVLEVVRSPDKSPLFVAEGVEVRGTLIADYLSQADAGRVLAFIKRTIETGEVQESVNDLKLPGREAWVAARAAPLALADGTRAVVVHLLDVTKRRRMEEELQRLREEIEARAEEGVDRAAEYALTFREITVLSLIARGNSDKEIADLLGLSPFTVNKHSSNLVRKMRARSRTEAAARAVREGII